MSDPSPWPSHDDGNHAVLLAAGGKTKVGNGFGLEYSKYSSEVIGVEGIQFVKVAFNHPPAI